MTALVGRLALIGIIFATFFLECYLTDKYAFNTPYEKYGVAFWILKTLIIFATCRPKSRII